MSRNKIVWGVGFIFPIIMIGNLIGENIANVFNHIQGIPSSMTFLNLVLPQLRFLIIYLLLSLVSWKIGVTLHNQFGSLKVGNKGVASFSNEDDLKKAYKLVPYQPEYDEKGFVIPYPGKAGSIVSRIGDQAVIDTDDAHSIVIARTRGGKTETKVLPDIEMAMRSQERPHIITSSVKHEVVERTMQEAIRRGYKPVVLNLIDMDYSMGYNCLELIKDAYRVGDIDEAVELCKTFSHPLYHNPNAKDPIWEDSAMSLVNALILAQCHEFINPQLSQQRPEYVTMNSLVTMLSELAGSYQLKNTTRYVLDEYFNALPIDNPAKLQYSTVAMTDGQMRSSIFGTTLAKLQKFTAPKVVSLMSDNTFHFKELTQSKQPYIIYIVLPDYSETNYIIASTWIQQCYYYLSKFASEHGDRLPKRVIFELDEFGNMPPFSSLSSMVSVGAGRGMLFKFHVQSLIQFKMKYGADTAKFIESQLMNIIYISTTDDETQTKFSKWLGDKEVIQKSRSGSFFSFNKNISEQVERRPLMHKTELAELAEGECVIIRSKRKNEEYEDVVAKPILNKEDNRLLKAHVYLKDIFSKTSYQELPIEKHRTIKWTTSQLKEFVEIIRRRLQFSPNIEIREQEKINHEEIKRKELEETMREKGLMPYSKYEHTSPVLDPDVFKDQILPEGRHSMEDDDTYQDIKKYISYYFKDLLQDFQKVSSYDELKQFLYQHPDKFHRFIQEVDHE